MGLAHGNQVFSNRQQCNFGDVSRRLLENIIISLLLFRKLEKCGIFGFNEEFVQVDGFSWFKKSLVGLGE